MTPYRRTILLAALAAAALPAHAGPGHDLKPKHGGQVQEVKDVTFELVARDGKLVLHLDDHGKPVPTKGASARATVLAGTDKREVALVPAGENRLETQDAVQLPPGARLAMVVNLPGKPAMTVRFALK
jgi:hypothetical protein